MGTEDWVLKGTKLITNTKKHRLKIQSLDFQKYNIKEKKGKKKVTKIIKKKYIYMKFALKNRVFYFCKVIVGYKNENYRSNRGPKF